MIGELPTVAPRLVFHEADVRDLLAEVADEHAALQDDVRALELQLEALTRDLPGWDVDEELPRAAASGLEAVYGQHREAALAALDAHVAAGELAAAERVAAAERDAAHRLALVRSEVGDRLVDEVDADRPAVEARLETPHSEASRRAVETTAASPAPAQVGSIEKASDVVAALFEAPETTSPAAVPDEQAEAVAWSAEEADSDRFRAFWSEQDEIASVREAVLAPLVAIAPMALALLVIVLLLIIVI